MNTYFKKARSNSFVLNICMILKKYRGFCSNLTKFVSCATLAFSWWFAQNEGFLFPILIEKLALLFISTMTMMMTTVSIYWRMTIPCTHFKWKCDLSLPLDIWKCSPSYHSAVCCVMHLLWTNEICSAKRFQMKTPAVTATVAEAVPLTASNRINMFAMHMRKNSGGMGDGSASMWLILVYLFYEVVKCEMK